VLGPDDSGLESKRWGTARNSFRAIRRARRIRFGSHLQAPGRLGKSEAGRNAKFVCFLALAQQALCSWNRRRVPGNNHRRAARHKRIRL